MRIMSDWGKSALSLAAVPAWRILAPAAIADNGDDFYLNTLAAHNIHSIAGPEDLVDAGHQVCGFLNPSTSPAMVTDYVLRASVNGGRFFTTFGNAHNPLTNSQAGILVSSAIGTYCPNSPGAVHWRAN
jgi:Protein of unknown function (DUF732)